VDGNDKKGWIEGMREGRRCSKVNGEESEKNGEGSAQRDEE